METALTERNLRHFSQADGTPFASQPLTNISDAARQLVEGTNPVDASTVSEAPYAIIQNVPLGPVPLIDSHIFIEELMQSYSRWRERTSTSPSGDHLGHGHAILQSVRKIDLSDDPHAQLDYRIFAIRAHLLNLAILVL